SRTPNVLMLETFARNADRSIPPHPVPLPSGARGRWGCDRAQTSADSLDVAGWFPLHGGERDRVRGYRTSRTRLCAKVSMLGCEADGRASKHARHQPKALFKRTLRPTIEETPMKITAVEPFILHVPLNRSSISDSTHSISHWGVVGVRV